MSAQERGALRPIRLVFELSRDENPRLFDELSQFRQGESGSTVCACWPTTVCWRSTACLRWLA